MMPLLQPVILKTAVMMATMQQVLPEHCRSGLSGFQVLQPAMRQVSLILQIDRNLPQAP